MEHGGGQPSWPLDGLRKAGVIGRGLEKWRMLIQLSREKKELGFGEKREGHVTEKGVNDQGMPRKRARGEGPQEGRVKKKPGARVPGRG